jgi:hypothetical protein
MMLQEGQPSVLQADCMGGVAIVHHLLVANLLLPCTGEQVGRQNAPKGSLGCEACEH